MRMWDAIEVTENAFCCRWQVIGLWVLIRTSRLITVCHPAGERYMRLLMQRHKRSR
jgi:hypothetical protein